MLVIYFFKEKVFFLEEITTPISQYIEAKTFFFFYTISSVILRIKLVARLCVSLRASQAQSYTNQSPTEE